MTPKEKAQELIDKYLVVTPLDANINDSPEKASKLIMRDRLLTKQCAIICANEVINKVQTTEWLDSNTQGYDDDDTREYWIEVQREISLL